MKFTIKREELLPALQNVCGVVEKRQALPILSNLLLNVSKDGIRLVGTDMEVELAATIAGNFNESGEITLSARKLLDICRTLPDKADIGFSVTDERAMVLSGKSRFTLSTLPAQEFPQIESVKGELELKVKQSEFKALLDKTSFAMAQQDVRFYLNGLLLEFESTKLRAVATDGHRLALAEMALNTGTKEERQLIVPRKAVLELSRLLDEGDSDVSLTLSKNHVRITMKNQVFTSKLIDGKFPDYKRVIPERSKTPVTADREALRQSLTRASILSNEKYHGVRIVLSAGKLRALAHNPEQEEAEEEMQVNYEGEEVEIGFNVSYLLDAISNIKGDNAIIAILNSDSSCQLYGEKDDSCLYVVMPMRL
ncbi:MAG: DNA polymerase III subunit beta [Gammaproteobacteria bacterium]